MREPRPGPSTRPDDDSEEEQIEVDNSPINRVEPLKLVLPRRIIRSDSEDDTDLSTLRTNLKRSGSESRGVPYDSESLSRDASSSKVLVNGVHSSSEDSNQVLATLKENEHSHSEFQLF